MIRMWGPVLLALSLVGCAAQDANKMYMSAFRMLEKAEAKEPQHRDVEKARAHFTEGRLALSDARYDVATQKFKESLAWSESIVDPATYEAKMAVKRAEAVLASTTAPTVAESVSAVPAPSPVVRPPESVPMVSQAPRKIWDVESRTVSPEPRALPRDALAKYLAMKRSSKMDSGVASVEPSSKPRPSGPSRKLSVPAPRQKMVPSLQAAPTTPGPLAVASPKVSSQPATPVEAPSMPNQLSAGALQPPPADLRVADASQNETPNFQVMPSPREIRTPEGMLTPQANVAEASAFEKPGPSAIRVDETSASATTAEPDMAALTPDTVALAEAHAAQDGSTGPQVTAEEARSLKKQEASQSETVKAPARPLDKFLPESAKPKSTTPSQAIAEAGLNEEVAVATRTEASKATTPKAPIKDPTKIPGELGFAPNDVSVEPQTMMTLDQTSKFLLENPSSVIQFQGVIGPGESSSLIDTRFESLRAYLVAKGVPEDQVKLATKRRAGTKAEFQMFLIED